MAVAAAAEAPVVRKGRRFIGGRLCLTRGRHGRLRRMGRKSVIVTGGAHGIGEAAVLAFARAGYQVALADVDREAGERVRQMSGAPAGGRHFLAAAGSRSARGGGGVLGTGP